MLSNGVLLQQKYLFMFLVVMLGLLVSIGLTVQENITRFHFQLALEATRSQQYLKGC